MFRSIRTRLTFSHLAVIVVAMGLSGFLLLSLLEQYFYQAMEDSLAAQARITAQALIPGASAADAAADAEAEAQAAAYNTVNQQRLGDISLQTENIAPPPVEIPLGDLNLDYLNQASLQLSTQLDTRIRILDSEGRVVVDSHQAEAGSELLDDPLVTQALAGQYASRSDRGGAQSEPAMYVALPILVDGELVGVAYLSQALRDVAAVMGDMRTRWLLATLIALLLSAVVGLLLSGAIARPVRQLTAAAGAVAEGQLDQKVPVRSSDELGRLSQTFNEMMERLRASRQVQTDFVANVSHELRTPLTAIKGLVETLRDGAVDDVQVRDGFLETVEGETDRLIRLVNGLLILSRADSEALDLRPEPVDLAALIQAVADRLAPQAQAQEITLQVEAAPHTPLALADTDRIAQVVVNVLDNAIKYSRPGGTVTIRLSTINDLVQVEVQDQGIGIPAGELERIGERFYRADKARARADGGSGLGLAIAQALVEAHGGRLWLESREGVGTTVRFVLPTAN